MSKIALMFPGQGSQYPLMGKDFYEEKESYRQLFKETESLLKINFEKIIFESSKEELQKTQNTQPALLLSSIGMLNVLLEEKNFHFDGVVGHSLGEYSAYVASKRLLFQDALKVVRERGLLMNEADLDKKGGMAAVLKLPVEGIEDVLRQFPDKNVVIANYNCPLQTVISGDKNDIEFLVPHLEEKKGRVMVLSVSGAFHSPFMKKTAITLKDVLKSKSISSNDNPLYTNVDGKPLVQGNERESLVKQLYSPVKFTQCIENMVKDGFDTFIEIGPSKVLQNLVKKMNYPVEVTGIEKLEDLNQF